MFADAIQNAYTQARSYERTCFTKNNWEIVICDNQFSEFLKNIFLSASFNHLKFQ